MIQSTTDKLTQTAKLLYEELVKSALRIMPLNDLEIVLGSYLMEKAKLGDMAKEEEDISQEININIQQLKEALKKLEKYRLIESFDLKIRKAPSDPSTSEVTRRKYYTFWRINNQIKKDLETVVEYLEKEFNYVFKKNKNKSFFVCQNQKCGERYSVEEAFMMKNRCHKKDCLSLLLNQTLNQQDQSKIQQDENNLKQIFEHLRGIINQIGNLQWPFEQNLEKYEYTPDLPSKPYPPQQTLVLSEKQKPTIKPTSDSNYSTKLKHLKQFYQMDIDISIENLLKYNLNYPTFVHLKSKIGNY